MSTASPQAASNLAAYAELFDALAELGIEFVLIGGCAVGAYARLLGETVFSNDLDLFLTRRALETVLRDSSVIGARIEEMPLARTIPVAVLSWRGLEINLLTASDGLPPPDVEARAAREFRIETGGERVVTVLVADPFDLLRNKLAVNRPKDARHIALLRRFLEAEIVYGFRHEDDPRARIAPAERLLEVLDSDILGPALAAQLLPLARASADFRFLAHRAPTVEFAAQVVQQAPDEATRLALERILETRKPAG